MSTQSTSEQLRVCEPAIYFSVGEWLDEGRELVKHGKYLANQESCRQWGIGDWLLKGEGGVQARALRTKEFKRQALKITRYKSWGALKNLMTISRRVPESRRRDGREGRQYLAYSIHQEIAKKFDDEETQERLLDFAAKGVERCVGRPEDWRSGLPMPVRILQRHIREMQDCGELPKTGKDRHRKKALEGHILLKIWVPNTFHSKLRAWAEFKFKKSSAAKMLAWLAEEYFKEHKADLEALSAAYEAEKAEFLEETRKRVEENERRAAARAEERKKAGLPIATDYKEYRERCAKLMQSLRKADKEANALLKQYLIKAFGVQNLRLQIPWSNDSGSDSSNVTRQQWEATLAKLESAGDPESVLQLIKSVV